MSYDGFYGDLSSRASVSEILNQAIRVQKAIEGSVTEIEGIRDETKAFSEAAKDYALQALYTFSRVSPGGSLTVGGNGATVTHITLSAETTSIFVDVNPLAQYARQYTLVLNQGVGSRKVAWPNNIRWSDSRVPMLSYDPNVEDIVTLLSIPGSSTYLGFFNGGSFA